MRKLTLKLTIVLALAAMMCAGAEAAQQRYIVRTTGGLLSVLKFCGAAGCQVQGSLDGNIGQTYLVTSSQNLLANLLNGVTNLLEAILGIQSVESDQVLPLPQVRLQQPGTGLSDTAPVNYYGSVVWHGYAAQPATYIIRLRDAQGGFGVTGKGIVATIDTGVDPNHPALVPVLLQGYDFTRNQPGASEWADVAGLPNGPVDQDSQDQQPAVVQQSTAAVLDQSTAAVLDGSPYVAFGHGTMTAGLIHLVAPKAKILPLKAFSSDGTAYLSNIIAALYYAQQHGANVVNMSFDLSVPSQALSNAVSRVSQSGVILVAAAGNENTSARVYPAALNGNVVGVASTTDYDARSSFSNYGNADVWIAAPGENIISTYPGATYASSSGTSFSSPIVAGTVALCLDLKSGLNQSKAASALSHARQLTPDLNHGRLDTYQTLTAWFVSW
ncbi:MAG TPA: S8 family serine peptidase [Candidatus Dormibacteraeota bacterium]|jgi:subtilisin family serine protease|nr:S8 family serine peptidase [Candidatus Dormibacteraeota bacterium]